MTIFAVTRGIAAAGLASFGLMVTTRALVLNYIDREDPRGKTAMRVAGSVAPLFVKLLTDDKSSPAGGFREGLLLGAIIITASLNRKDAKFITVGLLVATLVSLLFDDMRGMEAGIAFIWTADLIPRDLASILPFF